MQAQRAVPTDHKPVTSRNGLGGLKCTANVLVRPKRESIQKQDSGHCLSRALLLPFPSSMSY